MRAQSGSHEQITSDYDQHLRAATQEVDRLTRELKQREDELAAWQERLKSTAARMRNEVRLSLA